MSKPKVFEKPIGVRDYLPDIVRRLRFLQSEVMQCMERWGYEEIMTPTLEYFDTVGTASMTSESKLFKLLDPKGKTLFLRSDMTAPIARASASLLKDQPLPLRLSYHANVFRAPEEEAGRDAEFFQTGVELIGDASTDADAEVVALAIASLEAAGLRDFKMVLGHCEFMDGLIAEHLAGFAEHQQVLKQYLIKRNDVGYNQLLQQLDLPVSSKQTLMAALNLRGSSEMFAAARAMTDSQRTTAAIKKLEGVFQALSAYGVADHVSIDFTMVGDFSYYTGITFEGYAADHAFPVCSGGRYDLLLQQFGRTAPATGFSLKTNRILEWLGKQQARKDGTAHASQRVLILYDDAHRAEAIQNAQSMRRRHDIAVETAHWAHSHRPEVQVTADGDFHYNGRKYQDVLTFVNEEISL